MRYRIWLLFPLAVLTACSEKVKMQKPRHTQYVEVEKVFKVQKTILGKFSGRATKIFNNDFIVEASVPLDVAKGVAIGSDVVVMLPLINMGAQKARVVKSEKESISVKLVNQIHDLSDQEIEIQLPLKNAHMYEVPFSSIYSPMGGEAFVFSVQTDSVSRKKVDVIQVVGENKILVMASELNQGDRIVRRGLDNLVDGDKVVSEDSNEF